MEKKPCPVDRGKLLSRLEHRPDYMAFLPSSVGNCYSCSSKYVIFCTYVNNAMKDALAYIQYLEEQLNAKADNAN